MKTHLIIAFISTAVATNLVAGGINIVHVGPRDVLKFAINAAGDTLDFTLAHGAYTGTFILPDKPSTLKGFVEEIPSLELPASEDSRIAALAASGEGFKWHLIPAKPTPDKWSFRIINLSAKTANITANREPLEIASGAQSDVKVTGKSQIRIKIPDTLDLSYEGSEPSAVIAFLYLEDETWKAAFVPDR